VGVQQDEQEAAQEAVHKKPLHRKQQRGKAGISPGPEQFEPGNKSTDQNLNVVFTTPPN